MPLNFDEPVEQDNKKGLRPKAKASAGVALPKGAGPTALQLDTQVLPQLIRQVGDWKSGRISQQQLEAYLDRRTLIFDRELLAKMFVEADYQKEGSLDTRALAIAISGRFPKRELTEDWRKLTALLLGLQELVLAEDVDVTQRYVHERPSGGTFNSTAVWDSPPPALPPVRRRSGRARSKSSSSQPGGEWQATASAVAAAYGGGEGSVSLASTSGTLGGCGTVRTTGGVKQLGQIDAEARVNGSGLSGTEVAARSTFAASKEFADFSRGLELLPQLAGGDPGSTTASGTGRTASFLGAPKDSIRAWGATLPPTAISLSGSALQTLRSTIRSTTSSKPDFATRHRPLGSTEADLKRTLGAPIEDDVPLSRVEPVRGTSVLYNASYVEWCDYAGNCRTAPSRWYNEHPAAAAQDAGGHKYPWC